MRLAVSLVTCRQAATRKPLSGWSCVKRCRIRPSTGISRAAQSIRSWPCAARFVSFTSLPLELTFKIRLLIGDFADQFDVTELLAPVEVAELDQHLHPDHVRAQLPHQPDGGRGGPARGKNIIHDQDLLTGLHRVRVHLQLIGAVLEVVGLHHRHPGKLPRLANGHEAGTQLDRYGRSGDEPASLDCGVQVGRILCPCPGHQIDYLAKDVLVAKQGRDVAEDDPLLRIVGHVADVLLQLVGCRHRTVRKYASVCRKPSSSPISGCHPSSSLAWVMSGRRCFGSSTGSALCSIRLFDSASRMIVSASSSTVTSCGLPRL